MDLRQRKENADNVGSDEISKVDSLVRQVSEYSQWHGREKKS